MKTIEDQGIKLEKALKPGENQELESIECFFSQKRWKILKLKMK